MSESGGFSFDFMHALSGVIGALLGAGTAVVTWIVNAARMEPKLRADFEKAITMAESRIEDKIEASEKRKVEKMDALVDQFREYFEGIRRQQDEMKLNLEREFVRKTDFKEVFREFRDDLRKDFADLKTNVAKIVGNHE